MKIIAVCTGNTCRSPMAAAFLKDRIKDAKILSRGLFVPEQCGAAENAIFVMKEYGIDITHHVARELTEEEAAQCDLILTMTNAHAGRIVSACPEARGKVFTLTEYAGGEGDIADPYGGSMDDYRRCAAEILRAVENIEKDKS